jgi:hypothetical protein
VPRERSGIDYSAVADAPGGIPKPRAKRDRSEGRTAPGSSLRSYSTLQTRAPLKTHGANEERREDVDGEQAEACRLLPCSLCGAAAPSDPMHTPPRAQGGLDCDCIPGCRPCHDLLDSMRHSRFWRWKKINPEELKQAVRDWMNAGYPQGNTPWGKR